jgi:hypothetical protein
MLSDIKLMRDHVRMYIIDLDVPPSRRLTNLDSATNAIAS